MSTKPFLIIGIFAASQMLFVAPGACQGLPATHETVPAQVATAYRWWNLLRYTIAISPDYNAKFIRGTNAVNFTALQTSRVLQLDLQEPMRITRVTWKKRRLSFKKEASAYLISFPVSIHAGSKETVTVAFEGHPQTARKPPFESGWIWDKDRKGRPWMSVACEGAGASI